MIKKILLIILWIATAQFAEAQRIISGKIIDFKTKQGLPAASVFLSNTSVGTNTNSAGEFKLELAGPGRFNLIVALIGYETYATEVSLQENITGLKIELKHQVAELEEVVVGNYDKKGWEKWGIFFMEMLIGNTPNALNCKLLNKDAVKFTFSKKENILRAYATEPLRIENNALGFDLTYSLTQFEHNYKTRIFFYQGYPLFSERKPKNNRQYQKWLANRADTYKGSLMHFMRSVFRNKINEEGFEIKRIIRQKTPSATIRLNGEPLMEEVDVLINKPLNGDSIAFAIDNNTAGLQFKDYLQVVYKNKVMSPLYIRSKRDITLGDPVTAKLFMPDASKVVSVLANGSYFFGKDILTLDYWAWSEKLSNLLPLEYRYPQ
ncbi:carboxypeptidase-like regulatory domain-containing protein [Sediminibacterium sp. C3]|uniref:carboxypeptidase-like regulatory domain-containing protein n=1 Tax=Sediminibacterium sp. C3 TaxID=1267211 RepID=UPI000406EE4A|nr:carboxypeptidase-like regulatory domain-containing protein [Sediminibacterium sp. C3]